MSIASFSNWLEQVTKPHHPYYHPVQTILFASVSYISTACLTSLSPIHGMVLVTVAYAISQLVTPLFVECFEPHQDTTLAPLIGQVIHVTFSFVIAKVICRLAGHSFSFKEVGRIGIAFLVSLQVLRLALLELRKQLG